MSARILLIEDDEIFRTIISDNLTSEGYRVDAVGDGQAALAHLRSTAPDLILLDLTLPDLDGLELCPLLKKHGSSIPLIILSARDQKIDKLKGLRLGADDYIVKPTDMEELIARVDAVLRRARPRVDRLQIGSTIVDFRTQRAVCGHTSVRLTFHEFKLLEYLAQRPFQIVPREELLTEVWGYMNPNIATRSVDQTVVRLRKKLEPNPHQPTYIHTAPGIGYCLRLPE
jgi:DNA-binding response OmpR family regulator